MPPKPQNRPKVSPRDTQPRPAQLTDREGRDVLRLLQSAMIPAYHSMELEDKYSTDLLEAFDLLYVAFRNNHPALAYVSREYTYFVPLVSPAVRTAKSGLNRGRKPVRFTFAKRERLLSLLKELAHSDLVRSH